MCYFRSYSFGYDKASKLKVGKRLHNLSNGQQMMASQNVCREHISSTATEFGLDVQYIFRQGLPSTHNSALILHKSLLQLIDAACVFDLTLQTSEQSRSLSLRRYDVPWAIRASRSISPNLTPPPLFRPFTGWWVTGSTGPVVLTWKKELHPINKTVTKLPQNKLSEILKFQNYLKLNNRKGDITEIKLVKRYLLLD